jgi:hypothetical protein
MLSTNPESKYNSEIEALSFYNSQPCKQTTITLLFTTLVVDITYTSIMLIRHIALAGHVGQALVKVSINTQSCHHHP